MKAIALALCLLASGCGDEITKVFCHGDEIDFTVEEIGWGLFKREALFCARSAAEWKAEMLWLAADDALIFTPPPEPPAIDWTDRTLVVVSMGEFSEPQTLQVEDMLLKDGMLTVVCSLKDAPYANGIDSPHVVASIDAGEQVTAIQKVVELR